MLEEDEDSNAYFTDKNLIEDEYYLGIKDLVTCKLCHNILKEPMMCLECQKSFCKNCSEELTIDFHLCEKPNFIKNKNVIEMIQKLKYLCNNCKQEVKEADIESHIKNGCIKNKNPTKLIDAIYRKKALKLLTPGEKNKLSDGNVKVNHISGKILFK